MSDVYRGYEDQRSGRGAYNRRRYEIDSQLARLSTATLVKIVSAPYDKDGNAIAAGSAHAVGYIDVLPLVNQIDGNGKATKHETVNKLSYFRFAGGKNAILLDPVKGDVGVAVFADRDISSVKATGDQANPGSTRRWNMADGIFFGVCVGNDAPTQFIAFTDTGITIQDKNGNKMVMSSTGIAFTSTKLTNTGDVVAGQDTGDQVTLQHHLHVNSGGSGDSGLPKPGT